MERGEGEEDINLVLNTFNFKISNIINNDVNHDKNLEATSEVSTCEFDKEQAGWEDTNILAMKESFVNLVMAELPKKKAKFGFQKVIKDEDGFLFFKFTSLKGPEQVIEQGPWLIRNTPLILNKWTPNLVLKKEEVTKVPVRVKMHKIPVVTYCEDGLSLIATQIGKPIMLDAFTSSMCEDPWGRLRFARALIEVSADKALKKEVVMAISEEDGTGHTKETIRLEYEWKPPICIDYHVFVHSNEQCPKRVKEPVIETANVDKDGLTSVSKKKKKGRTVEKWQPNSSKQPKQAHASTKNQFDVLEVQNDDTLEMGKASGEKKDKSEVHQVVNENHLSVCAILESHVKISGLANVCSKVFRSWDWTSNANFCPKGNVASVRRHLWTKLDIHKHVVQNSPWVLMGDFNVAFNMEDVSSGSSMMNSAMSDFKDCVANIEVLDVNCSGLHYTWNQKPKGSHGHAMYQVVQKLKALKKPLRKLLQDQGNLHYRVSNLRLELDEVQKALDQNPDDVSLRDEEAVYVQAFNNAKLDEERFLKEKAKVEWLAAGDANSAYFYKTIKSKNHQSHIMNILDANGIEVTGHYVPDVLNASNCQMVWDISNEEIKAAMFDISDDRVPGPDGYTSAFFKNGWDIVEIDVSTPSKVNDYQPISCCNVLYKCISKILTNRIIDGIKEVVSENQSVFVPGRRISDNILITQELMHHYHWDRGPPMCAFKVDIQKAYDTVDWRFLEIILVHFSFHPTMIKWFMVCVMSASFSLSINGDIYRFFKSKRGLRQGDPLSPYLFTLVMKVLTLILKRRVRNSDSFRYHKHCKDLKIINVCFADDLFIFSRGDVDSTHVIMESLKEFKRVSGIMPFLEGELPVKYLGVPLISSRLLNKDCKVLVEKAKNHMGDWKNKSLSFAGRLQLCKFLWCNGEYKRGRAKVAWDDFCLPKHEGGLGILSLELFNIALMTTHIWNIVSNKVSLWVRWIYAYKLNGRTIWDVPEKADMSWGWRKLLQIQEVVRPFFWVQLGNGKNTSLWFDIWCSSCPLNSFLTVRDITYEGFHINSLVADMVGNGGWMWPHAWLLKAPILGTLPVPNLDNNSIDIVKWRDFNGNMNDFSVKRAWEDVGVDVDLNMIRCPLCESQKDSHAHLFFECPFSAQVWSSVRQLAGMDLIQPVLSDIMLFLQPMENCRTVISIIGRLILVASSYFIWLERNNRIFKKVKKHPEEIKNMIMVTVRLKLLTFKFKNSVKVNRLLSR
ncbi:hypothetical protein Tco_1200843 [Tanacetum coccineum]